MFRQGDQVRYCFFVLYGALMVSIKSESKKRVGDVVRGGNVLGEEAFFCHNPIYKESAACKSDDAGLLMVDAEMLSQLGAEKF